MTRNLLVFGFVAIGLLVAACEEGLPLGGALHRMRFARATGVFSTLDRERADLLAKRLGLAVELTG